MKSKTSITLSEDVLSALDHLVDEDRNRSALIERAVREFLARTVRDIRDKKDREILDRNAVSLNAEAEEILDFQIKR